MPLSLDINGFYALRLENNQLVINLSSATEPYFLQHIGKLLKLKHGDNILEPTVTPNAMCEPKRVVFDLTDVDASKPFTLTMNNQPVSDLRLENGALAAGQKHSIYQLSVSETRAYGMALSEKHGVLNMLPYDRTLREGFDPKKHAPITDLHTHSSAQVSASAMMEAALEIDQEAGSDAAKGLTYPVELLQKLGVPAHKEQPRHSVRSYLFKPTANENLACERDGGTCEAIRVKDLSEDQRKAIIQKMQVMGDKIIPFGDFDPEFYRFRNPLTKHPGMARKMIRQIATEYAKNGIEYAELSTSSMTNPAWLADMIREIDAIEKEGGIEVDGVRKPMHLRFLVCMMRSTPPQQMLVEMERIKFLARHPYIVGMDLVGYESNKTRDFHWALSHMAQWAAQSQGTELKREDGWDMQRDFMIRVHAGETGKNPENVEDALKISREHKVRVRVAHALNVVLTDTDHEEIKRLSGKGEGVAGDQFALEMCPDSNQVFLNKPLVHDVPMPDRYAISPVFLGSDGGGGLNITPTQLAYSSLATGMSLQQLEEMQAYERGYIDRQLARERSKRRAFDTLYHDPKDFLDGYKSRLAELKSLDEQSHYHEEALDGKEKEFDALNQQISALNAQRAAITEKVRNPRALPASMQGKKPILIGGASGDSWKDMTANEQRRTRQTIEMLVQSLDPEKCYFVLGRVKNEGVSKVLDEVVKAYNRENATNQFQVLARYAGADKAPTEELPETITAIHNIPGDLSNVPKSMVDFIKEEHGTALFFGGSNFTGEMVFRCFTAGVPFHLFTPQHGLLVENIAPIIPDSFQTEIVRQAKKIMQPFAEFANHAWHKLCIPDSPDALGDVDANTIAAGQGILSGYIKERGHEDWQRAMIEASRTGFAAAAGK